MSCFFGLSCPRTHRGSSLALVEYLRLGLGRPVPLPLAKLSSSKIPITGDKQRSTALEWRVCDATDIGSVMRVADAVHPGLPEDSRVFAERVALFPRGCYVLASSDDIYGYAISHPIYHGKPAALNSLLGEIAVNADQYYIHDVAILPEAKRRGHATAIIKLLLDVAEEFLSVSLISVYGTTSFWERFGFRCVEDNETIRSKLREYGEEAVFLTRSRQ